MYSLLLKKALPFALTFILGSLIGGLFNFFFGVGGYKPAPARAYFYGYGEGRHSCRMRARTRYLVAETKPLQITFKPDARLPRQYSGLPKYGFHLMREGFGSAMVSVTFGADGKIQNAALSGEWLDSRTGGLADASTTSEIIAVSRAAEYAARQIQFEPETVDGVPVTVTREIEIHFMAD